MTDPTSSISTDPPNTISNALNSSASCQPTVRNNDPSNKLDQLLKAFQSQLEIQQKQLDMLKMLASAQDRKEGDEAGKPSGIEDHEQADESESRRVKPEDRENENFLFESGHLAVRHLDLVSAQPASNEAVSRSSSTEDLLARATRWQKASAPDDRVQLARINSEFIEYLPFLKLWYRVRMSQSEALPSRVSEKWPETLGVTDDEGLKWDLGLGEGTDMSLYRYSYGGGELLSCSKEVCEDCLPWSS